jgi:type II secretory pathway component PulJ
MQRKSGASLIEVVAAIGLISIVLTMLAGWLTAAMRHQRAAGEHLLQLHARDQLAEQFRKDVHAAQEVMEMESRRLLLALDEPRRVEYFSRDGMVHRWERKQDEIVHREQYAVGGEGVQVGWNREGKHPQITLLLPGLFEIQAMPGSDRRFERLATHEK